MDDGQEGGGYEEELFEGGHVVFVGRRESSFGQINQ